MAMIDDELERLDGPHWPCITDADQDPRAKMWKRGYLVALHAMDIMSARIQSLQSTQYDSPAVFFYPPDVK